MNFIEASNMAFYKNSLDCEKNELRWKYLKQICWEFKFIACENKDEECKRIFFSQ